ncbi:MAG TPA: DUF3887 domain-containing protein [Pseudonocardiaceae bacterium]|nr:DUF3887 domain-containing protein [Pseudonocardiaceae bacterium]
MRTTRQRSPRDTTNTTPATTSPARHLIAMAALGLSVALGLLGCGAHAATAPPATSAQGGYGQRAVEELSNIVSGNDAAVIGDLDPDMHQLLSADALAQYWTAFQQKFGTYQSHGQPDVIPRGELTVVNVPLNMARQPGQFRITFHRDGRIAGLYFLRPGVPMPPSQSGGNS